MTNSLLNDLNVVDSSLNTSNLNANTNSKRKTLNLPLSRIKLDPANVRRSYDEVYINELAESINDVGLLQSISVRPDEENPGEYIINMGHYRYLAHQKLGKETIESTIDKLLGSRKVKMTENMIRKDMSLLEVAENLKLMLEDGLAENPNYSYEDLGAELKRSKSWVSRRLQLLDSDDYLIGLMDNKMVNDAETGSIIKNLLVDYPEEVKALVADHEGAISSKLARVWAKELKGELTQEVPVITAKEETVNTALHSEPSDTSVEELTKLQKDAEDLIQKQHVQTEIEEVVHSNVKTEEDNKNFSTTSQKESKEILKKSRSQFSELDQAYYNGVLESYAKLLDWSESEDQELAAVSKGILRSFNTEDSANLFSWKSLIAFPEVIDELNSILDGMGTLKTFVSTSEIDDHRMQVILNQQSLI
ncbi:ParB/RepB/Spo0J family partition protein [Acinetobacter baumannii]|uniref:Putative transcriptional regulator n=2 Tax=Acinetobacter baumannii TaxID=470 RepID=A0A0C4Y2K9_ACIBA|nr:MULTISPECIES: ParB/RepB/Spo0J family partition protein [Acinetobacter calcoaceticus/baumannii complex]AFI97486.1 putative transcriptional regulator [Acinetobacter baumannii MDR-TJ]AGQ12280.1 putative transcriptional regulator [Acinetobacter baumannii BJAB0868]AGQ16141.1 putative transcriptional regulators [Acinetobacter baumannii BJAB07104]AJF79849.1 putative transcriptional regulator [Acinetobacter baumannii]APF45728.1 transcriptional regulator [Acinetobacter baumannii]